MPPLPPYLGHGGSLLATSIRIGSIQHPASKADDALRRYCKHLFMNSDFPGYPHFFRGSATVISVGGRYFLFCCGHQLARSEPEQVAFRPEGSNVTASPSHLLRPKRNEENADSDHADVAAFEYRIANYAYPLSSEFFPVADEAIWPRNANGRYCAIGFPDERQSFMGDDEPQFTARRLIVGANYDGASSEPYLHRLKLDEKVSSRGMSGGPVFYTGRIGVSFFIGWAGMIIRGGDDSEYLHFLSAQHLIEMVLRSPIIAADAPAG